MSNLEEIEKRHRFDRLKDPLFICVALLLAAISIGSVTSKGVGNPLPPQWEASTVFSNVEVAP